mmetsp:Transcript_22596/g.47135  ORF Transcript_22596/g.47135 Transcript_22596/m.47135 type:complete len:93 (+) Transcript_22596:1170-1448(+)
MEESNRPKTCVDGSMERMLLEPWWGDRSSITRAHSVEWMGFGMMQQQQQQPHHCLSGPARMSFNHTFSIAFERKNDANIKATIIENCCDVVS